MSVFLIKLEVGNVHMDDDGSVVHDVMVHILKILRAVPQFLDSVKKHMFFTLVELFTDPMHVVHRINLQLTASLECLIPLTFEEKYP